MDDSNVPCWGGNIEERRGRTNLTEVQFCHKLLLKIMTVPSSSSSCEHCSSLAYLCSLGMFFLLKIRMAEHEMFLFLAAKSVSPALGLHLGGKQIWLLWMALSLKCPMLLIRDKFKWYKNNNTMDYKLPESWEHSSSDTGQHNDKKIRHGSQLLASIII